MSGVLDGCTLLRYAHIYRERASGGTEQYLRQVNEGLLARNQMTIIQMHLVTDEESTKVGPAIERFGLGSIVWFPVLFRTLPTGLGSCKTRLKTLASTSKRISSVGRISMACKRAVANSFGHFRYRAMILSDSLLEVIPEFGVDLIAFHWLSYDVPTLMRAAAKKDIPRAYIHHFDNARLRSRQSQKWLSQCEWIGGVSGKNVPAEVTPRFRNLSDAVDLDFFSIEKARPVNRPQGFVITLAARILPGKGHLDVLQTAAQLIAQGSDVNVIFAGSTDSHEFANELRQRIAGLGIESRVRFLDELKPADLRDWYAASNVVILPSYSEGLGRVLVEAQAMKVPVIAYDTGGMSEAMESKKTGFLVALGSVAGLAEKIGALIENESDRRSMGNAGREFVTKRFSQAALVDRHESFYADVLSRSNKTGMTSNAKE